MSIESHRVLALAVLSLLGVGVLSACMSPPPAPATSDTGPDATVSAPAS
ncbi:hypothetical protein [Salinibacterium sp. TMP30]